MGEDGWKSNLNAQQQQKVLNLEKNQEILKKELEKKTMSCDILQQTMEKEKRKVDEEKSNTSQIQKELASLREKMGENEKKTEKLIHEMTAKEQLNINLQVREKFDFSKFLLSHSQWAIKFTKVQAKKKLVKSNKSFFPREIAFLAVLNFFPVEKLIFGHF